MPEHRVVVHFMHEREEGIAAQLVRNGTHTDGTIVGLLDDDDIKKLREEGVVVQVLDEPAPPRLRSFAVRTRSMPRMMAPDAAGLQPLPPPPPIAPIPP